MGTVKNINGKICTKCREWKRIDKFNNDTKSVDGKSSWCKECNKKNAKRRRVVLNNRNNITIPIVKKCVRCGIIKHCSEFDKCDSITDGLRGYCKLCVIETRYTDLIRRSYNLTIVEWNIMYQQQDGKCSICGCDFNLLPMKHIHVDHNHITNQVRSLLCHNCNTMIGLSKDNPDILRSAADYLDSFALMNNEIQSKRVVSW